MLDILVLTTVVLSQCAKVEIHKEWRELTAVEQNNFLKAVVCLRTLPNKTTASRGFPQPRTRWEDFVSSHSRAAGVMHNTAQFLPWHRVMLGLFDKALREECNYLDTLPYWDWSIDSEAPEKSVIWKDFGSTGCISTPVLGNLTAFFPNEHCVRRNSNMMNRGSVFSPEQIGLILANPGYNEFRVALESNPHNLGHSLVGGDMGSTVLSPNDPIFFMHHRNIDRLWAKWQKANPSVAFSYSGNASPRSTANDARPTDVMNFFGLTRNTAVSNALDSKSGRLSGLMCFDYSDSITPNSANLLQKRDRHAATQGKYNTSTPSIEDRSNLWNLRPPQQIPTEFLKNWMYNDQQIADIRKREQEIAKFTEFLNTMPLVFQTSLEQLDKGARFGWRSKTAEEAQADDRLTRTLVQAFKAQQ
jgi:hypothetical protein